MKTIFLNIICLLFSFQLVLAQGESDNYKYDNNVSLLDTKERTLFIASNFYRTSSPNILNDRQNGNNVQIQQVGKNNYVYSLLKAIITDMRVSQKGNDNEVLIDKQANSIYQKVLQEGNNNNIADFALYSDYDVNMELIQQGNNQNIQNYGSNSISKNMKVIQSGNGASVVIINNKKQ